MNDNVKFRRMSLGDKETPDISITPVKDGFHLFSEKSGLTLGTFSRKYLLNRGTFSKYQLDNIRGTTNFKALNMPKRDKTNHIKETKKIKWGFDLTGFDSAKQFENLLLRNGLDPVKSYKKVRAYPDDESLKDYYRFIWSGRYLKIVTGNNPITGEYTNKNMRKNEKGYASYIGIEGYPFYVHKLVKDIKKTGSIGGESPYEREFI